MDEITEKDGRLMEAARKVMDELTAKTADLYRGTDNSRLMALKNSAGDALTSTELSAIMHMMIFLSDDSLSAKMKAAVDEYTSA